MSVIFAGAIDKNGVPYLTDLCDMKAADLNPKYMEKALRGIRRFSGSGTSVWNHSIEVAVRAATYEYSDEQSRRLAVRLAFLHDFHEAIVGDIVTPIKRLIPHDAPLFGVIDRVDELVYECFGLKDCSTNAESAFKTELVAVARADRETFCAEILRAKKHEAYGEHYQPVELLTEQQWKDGLKLLANLFATWKHEAVAEMDPRFAEWTDKKLTEFERRGEQIRNHSYGSMYTMYARELASIPPSCPLLDAIAAKSAEVDVEPIREINSKLRNLCGQLISEMALLV